MRTALCATALASVAIAYGQTPGFGSSVRSHVIDSPWDLPVGIGYAPDRTVITFQPNTSAATKNWIANSYGLVEDTKVSNKYFTAYVLQPSAIRAGVRIENVVTALNNYSAVRYAELDPIITKDFIPNDPRFNQQWGMHNTGQTGGSAGADINAPEAWDIFMGLPDIIVAVCDDGFDMDHEDLVNSFYTNTGEIPNNGIDDDGNGFIDDVRGWDFINNDNDPNNDSPFDAHGTHTAGTVGATFNNGKGVAGCGPNIKIMPLKMYPTGDFNQYMSALAASVDYAWENGASVISVSYNINGFTQGLLDAILRARTAGVIYVGSAGNSGQANPPRQAVRAAADNVIFVAATDHNDQKAGFSNYGTLIEIAAPGVNIMSTLPDDSYGNNSGTSMSCPHVAGVVGVLWSANPGMAYRDVLDGLIGGADSLPSLAAFIPDGRRLNFGNGLGIITVENPSAVTPLVGTHTGGNIASFTAIDGNTYDMSSENVTRRGQYAGYEINWTASDPTKEPKKMLFDFAASGDSNRSTLFFTIYNVTTGKWDHLRSMRLSSSMNSINCGAGSDVAKHYMDPNTGLIRVRISVTATLTRGGTTPTPFNFSTDYCLLTMTQG